MHNQTIAKLLAKEDITIQHGNYHTAWFDVKNRTLGLPLWKDMGKDVYDLLIGHEVGHALYTPFEGWHDSPEKLEGAPRSYLNVCEDARIERFVQRDYPGLVGPFRRGYEGLVERGFFKGIDDIDWDKTKLIDKINIKAKLGNSIRVPFSKEENVFFKRALNTNTFEEVVELARDILKFTQENTPELLKKPEPEPGLDIPEGLEEVLEEGEAQPPMGHDDYLEEDESSSSTDETESSSQEDVESSTSESESEDGEETDDRKEDNNTSSESDDADTPSTEEDSTTGKSHGGEDDESLTDVGNREAEKDLIETDKAGRQVQFMSEPNDEIRKRVIVSYKELAKARKNKIDDYFKGAPASGAQLLKAIDYHTKNLKPYIKQVTKSANYAVKEFEMRKAAYQWQRAQTAKSGSLDVNLVHSYKYNEDIFARVTQLANAKNHGIIMFIDYSGSMSSTLAQVIDQLIHLVIFCKKVNIPFDVYAFTTNNHIDFQLAKDGEIAMFDTHLTQLISSDLKKKEYEEALLGLYLRMKANETRDYYYSDEYSDEPSIDEWIIAPKEEEYGSTPLNQCLVLAHRMVREFRAKHNLDKMNLVVLSDGDSNYINQHKDHSLPKENRAWNDFSTTNLLVDKKVLKLPSGRGVTHKLLQNISKRYNCTTIGFFVSDSSHDWNRKLWECNTRYEDRKDINKEYRKNKCVTIKNAVGYDEFYLVKGGSSLSAKDDEFEIDSDASTARIRTAFKKFATSKKNNKTLLTNFGKKVA